MKPFSLVAAAIFLLMALAHLYRIAVGFPIMIGSTSLGPAVSWAGLIVASVLSIGLFREALRGNPPHLIKLVADFDQANPNRIKVAAKVDLPPRSDEHEFKFRLDDQTGKNVRFAGLTSADDCSTCPPDTTKPNTQIHDMHIHNSPGQSRADFKNRNNNPQPMDVSYQWTFTCDPGFTVDPFDPIISNGGRV
jgi:hypothetical protein